MVVTMICGDHDKEERPCIYKVYTGWGIVTHLRKTEIAHYCLFVL